MATLRQVINRMRTSGAKPVIEKRVTHTIEVTDTFGGDANYSWVRRYSFHAKTERAAIIQLGKVYGSGWRKAWDDGKTSRYDLTGGCVCAFVTEIINCAEIRTPG